MRCANCGFECGAAANYCPSCGVRIRPGAACEEEGNCEATSEQDDSSCHAYAQAQVAASRVAMAELDCATLRERLGAETSTLVWMTVWAVVCGALGYLLAAGSDGAGTLVFVGAMMGPSVVGLHRWTQRHGWFVVLNWAFIAVAIAVSIVVGCVLGPIFYVVQIVRVVSCKNELEGAELLLEDAKAGI